MSELRKVKRCEWSKGSDLEIRYHDEEWGTPLHEDQRLFEFILLCTCSSGSARSSRQRRSALSNRRLRLFSSLRRLSMCLMIGPKSLTSSS